MGRLRGAKTSLCNRSGTTSRNSDRDYSLRTGMMSFTCSFIVDAQKNLVKGTLWPFIKKRTRFKKVKSLAPNQI